MVNIAKNTARLKNVNPYWARVANYGITNSNVNIVSELFELCKSTGTDVTTELDNLCLRMTPKIFAL